MNLRTLLTVLALALLPLTSCMSPKGDTPAEQRINAIASRDLVLEKVKVRDTHMMEELPRYPGYLTWDGGSAHLGVISLASGFMTVTDLKTQKIVYRKFFRFGLGPGLAFKGFYGLAVIKDEKLLQKFMTESSFNMGAGAEASFIFGSFGGSAVAEATFSDDIDVNIHTSTGVALELFAAGLWSWNNKTLNEPDSVKP